LSALTQAKAAAATKDVVVMGGANIARQYIRVGLLDEMRIHLVPVLLGAGTRLLDDLGPEHVDLEPFEVVNTPQVTHLRYRFPNTAPPRPLTKRPRCARRPPGRAAGLPVPALPAWLAGRSMRAYAGQAPDICLAALRRRKVHRECASGCP
jgi:hypothetical protein